MRILHIIESADPRRGGPIEGACRFGEAWAKTGHLQDLLTLDPPDSDYLPDYPGRIFNLGRARSRSSLRDAYLYSADFVPWIEAHAPDYDAAIVAGFWRYHTRGAVKALANGALPYFVYPHGTLDPWFRKASPIKHAIKQVSWFFAEGPLVRHARNVLFTCEDEQILAENAFWPYHVNGQSVGYGTADVAGDPLTQIAAFRAALPSVADRRFLLFLSRIHPKKGCDLLIDGFAAAAATNPDLDLVIAGPDQVGLVAQLKEQAERLGLGKRVHFPGMLSGDIKYGAFRAAEAFVLTSHQENFGIVVAEAMACGTPVLISNKVNIYREVLADGAGMVEPDTKDGAKTLLARFLALPVDERMAMRARARASFLDRFLVERAAEVLINFIGERTRSFHAERARRA